MAASDNCPTLCGTLLVVWKLDRLGRSLHHLVKTVSMLSERGVGLKVLTGQGAQIDTTTAAGRRSFGIFAALAVTDRLALQLPISVWWRRCDAGSFDEVGEAGEASPYDGRPRWRVGRAVEIASEARDRPDIEFKIARLLPPSTRGRMF